MSYLNLTLSAPATGGKRILQVVETLELWAERWHQRRTLRELPDHALRDLALSPADVEAEARKPFWQA